jgi:hypothetical protein
VVIQKVRFAPAAESLTDGSHNTEQSFAESLRIDHLGMAIEDRTTGNVESKDFKRSVTSTYK